MTVDVEASNLNENEKLAGFGFGSVPTEPEPEAITGEIIDVNEAVIHIPDTYNGSSPQITTEIATISVASAYTETTVFRDTLLKIPEQVAMAETLLQEYRSDADAFLEKYDEDTLEEKLKEMAEISKFSKSISANRKDIAKHFNNVRDEVLGVLDGRLTEANFDGLKKAQDDIKRVSADLKGIRANARWEELRVVFDGNIQLYPRIATLAPGLCSFDMFRLLNPTFVSGAKTQKITAKKKTEMNNIINEWDSALAAIEQNLWNLGMVYYQNLLDGFIKDPTMAYVSKTGLALAEREKADVAAQQLLEAQRVQAAAEAEALRKQQLEIEAQAKIQREAQALALAQQNEAAVLAAQAQQAYLEQQRALVAQQQALQQQQASELINQYVQPVMRQMYPEFVEYLFSKPEFHDVHSNPQTKTMIIYEMMMQITDSNSVVFKAAGGMNPSKINEMIRFVLDV